MALTLQRKYSFDDGINSIQKMGGEYLHGESAQNSQQQRLNRQMVPAELLIGYQFPPYKLEEKLATRCTPEQGPHSGSCSTCCGKHHYPVDRTENNEQCREYMEPWELQMNGPAVEDHHVI